VTHLKYEQRHLGDERWIDAGADAFAIHTWAIAYCDEQGVNGVISRRMARRVALPVDGRAAEEAVDRLVELGFWADNGDGSLTILDYLEHALAAEEKEETRAKWAADKKRRSLHGIGNHSLCTPNSKCAVARQNSTGDSTSGNTGGSTASIPNQTRPDQTPVGVSGSGMSGSDGQQSAHGSAAPPAATEQGWDDAPPSPPPAPPLDPVEVEKQRAETLARLQEFRARQEAKKAQEKARLRAEEDAFRERERARIAEQAERLAEFEASIEETA